jgi:MFS family permease
MSSFPLSAAQGAAYADGALQSASRKNLLRLVPLLAIGYFFNYIDRTNIGFAALTMNHDLGLTNTQFGAAAGMFFIGYCLLEVPSNLALHRFGARRWLARIMVSWGLLASACAFVGGPTSFYILRILTGAAAVALPERRRGRWRHGLHQCDRQPRRLRGSVDGRGAEGRHAFVPCGHVAMSAMLGVAAALTVVLIAMTKEA